MRQRRHVIATITRQARASARLWARSARSWPGAQRAADHPRRPDRRDCHLRPGDHPGRAVCRGASPRASDVPVRARALRAWPSASLLRPRRRSLRPARAEAQLVRPEGPHPPASNGALLVANLREAGTSAHDTCIALSALALARAATAGAVPLRNCARGRQGFLLAGAIRPSSGSPRLLVLAALRAEGRAIQAGRGWRRRLAEHQLNLT